MTETFAEGDLVEAVKGEDVHRGRVEARMDGLLCLGESGYRLDYYERVGFTLTVKEKALPPLPTTPGVYLPYVYSDGRTPNVWLRKADGQWLEMPNAEGYEVALLGEDVIRRNLPTLTRLAPVAEVLAVFAEKANWIPTAAAIQDAAKHFGVTL